MSKQTEDEMELFNRAASCVVIEKPTISFWMMSVTDFRCHPWQPDPSIIS
jgi:hypothetical protein